MKRVVLERVLWESKDGKRFDDIDACKKWEEKYVNVAREKMGEVPHVFRTAKSLYEYGWDDVFLLFIAPQNDNHVVITNEWLRREYIIDDNDVFLTHDDVGKIRTLYIDDNDRCFYERHYKDLLAATIHAFANMEKELNKKINNN